MHKIFLLLLMACLPWKTASAQYAQCGSQPVYQNGQVVAEQPIWCRESYQERVPGMGYLAMDAAATAYATDIGPNGMSGGAQKRALAACEKYGRPCKIVTTFSRGYFNKSKQCVGIADDGSRFFWSFGGTEYDARANAAKACAAASENCKPKMDAVCAGSMIVTRD